MEDSNEWSIVDGHTIERELKGAEYLINLTEEMTNGNYQLIFQVTLEGTIPHEDLKKRFQPAYLQLRRQFPLLGLELDISGKATFHALGNVSEAKEWVEEVTEVIQAPPNMVARQVAVKVAEQPLDTANRVSKAYLVLGHGKHQSGLIIHSSHALTGHYGIQVIDNFAKNLVNLDSNTDIESCFEPEVCSELISRLPGSLEKAYYETFKPSKKEITDESMIRQNLMELQKKPRLGIPVIQNAEDRPSVGQNLYVYFDTQKTKTILDSIKQNGLSPTTAYYASIICAIATLYGKRDQKTIEGCMLNFSAHASRWIPCEGQTGNPAISMAIIPGSIWLELNEDELDKELNKDSVVLLAKRLSKKQKTSLASPHSMCFATETVNALKAGNLPTDQEKPEISNAILTSQGDLKISRGHQKGDERLDILDYHCFGRNTDPTVCFALCSLFGTLRITALFDEKYFDKEEVQKLMDTSIDFLISLQQTTRDARL